MLPKKWPQWIVIPIGFLLVAVVVGFGLGLVTAVQASVPPVEVVPSATSVEEGSMQDPDLLAYAHAQEGLDCPDCHRWEEAMVEGSSMQRTVDTNSFCLDCHVENEHSSMEQIIERTADYMIEGESINPHEDQHTDIEEEVEQSDCRHCHGMHEESLLINGCYGCHHEYNFDEGCGGFECHEEYE